MYNELIFIIHALIISISALIALRLGREALVGFIALQSILANLFVIKQTTLLGISATVADPYAIGAVFGLNLLQEYYGKDIARKSIWISFFLLVFYGIVTQIHLAYLPSSIDESHAYFKIILDAMPRLVIASFITYIIVQYFDSWLFGVLKKKFEGKKLLLRNTVSISMSQFLDTILFTFLGLYGLVPNILGIIIVSYAIKLATIAVVSPFIALSKKIYHPSDEKTKN